MGLLFAALCAVNGAFVPAFAKLTTNAGSPTFVATATTLFAAAFASVVLAARGELKLLAAPQVRLRLIAVAALGTASAYLLFYAGVRRSTAIESALCLQIEPLYALVAAWVVLGHRPTRRRLTAIVVLLVGIVCAVGPSGFVGSAGVWLLLMTPLCWQASHLVVLRGLPGIGPAVLTGARFIHGGFLLGLFCILSRDATLLPDVATLLRLLPLLAVQGIVLTYLGTLAWYQAIARLDLARTTAIVVPSIPVLSLGASFLLLRETPSPWQWIGLVLTAAGVGAFVTAPDAIVPSERSRAVSAPVAAASPEA